MRSRVRVTGLGFGFAGRRHQSLKLRVGENTVRRLRELAGDLEPGEPGERSEPEEAAEASARQKGTRIQTVKCKLVFFLMR